MTAQSVHKSILRMVGIRQYTAQAAGSLQDSYSTVDGQEAVDAINQALQEIAAKGPRYLTHRTIGLTTTAPRSVTLTVSAGSKTISGASPAGWFIPGSTILVNGDPVYNQVDSSSALAIPFNGTSGATTALIYSDALALDRDVSALLPPVWLNQIRQLAPAASIAELLRYDYLYSIGDNYGLNQYSYYPTGYRPRTVGAPLSYMVESFYQPGIPSGAAIVTGSDGLYYRITVEDGILGYTVTTDAPTAGFGSVIVDGVTLQVYALTVDGGAFAINPVTNTAAQLSYRLRLVPIPDAVYSISAEARIAPVQITLTDVGTDASDPGITFGLPNSWDQAILLPFAKQIFTGSSLFKNESVKAEIARQYQTALTILRLANPQGVRGQRILCGPY